MNALQSQLSLLKRGTVEIIQEAELVEKLKRGKPLRIKAGFDPTAPDLHLGHTVLLQKLRQFQGLGHRVIFLIGDFTAMIGDPSGRNETRPALEDAQIVQNVKSYQDQVFKILDPEKTEVAYNSRWLSSMTSRDLLKLAARHTVARMLERDDFEKRYKKGEPISIHEFLYPLLQGYDSVALKADVELGGTDQKFNLLVGRELQRQEGQEPQVVMTLPLLVGTDGIQKMSKSYGNFIGIQESASQIFGKIMSISDKLMWSYYELLSDLDSEALIALKAAVNAGNEHPKEVKRRLGVELAARFHGDAAANAAAVEFDNVFKNKGIPEEVEEITLNAIKKGYPVVDLLLKAQLVPSKSEARRLIQQGGISINDKKLHDINSLIGIEGAESESLIRVGKRRFVRIVVK